MYLSKIYIKNFRGIKELLVKFDKKLNVIIGSNGQLKTSLVDAIRLFYSWGEPNRDIEITKEDFPFFILPIITASFPMIYTRSLPLSVFQAIPSVYSWYG